MGVVHVLQVGELGLLEVVYLQGLATMAEALYGVRVFGDCGRWSGGYQCMLLPPKVGSTKATRSKSVLCCNT